MYYSGQNSSPPPPLPFTQHIPNSKSHVTGNTFCYGLFCCDRVICFHWSVQYIVPYFIVRLTDTGIVVYNCFIVIEVTKNYMSTITINERQQRKVS